MGQIHFLLISNYSHNIKTLQCNSSHISACFRFNTDVRLLHTDRFPSMQFLMTDKPTNFYSCSTDTTAKSSTITYGKNNI
ncbi:hypothetical protein GDO86_010405 [Hymenochirus boettgeri]|uniref:Uncharacterized protein n=1 Tax=Hymenochirus boettgeri TaxID=247094 RepID=A0A8T2JMX1_9PIPI|nr:hypothetical protein GDO86_010405 [Hymenochirus boettgeri]